MFCVGCRLLLLCVVIVIQVILCIYIYIYTYISCSQRGLELGPEHRRAAAALLSDDVVVVPQHRSCLCMYVCMSVVIVYGLYVVYVCLLVCVLLLRVAIMLLSSLCLSNYARSTAPGPGRELRGVARMRRDASFIKQRPKGQQYRGKGVLEPNPSS